MKKNRINKDGVRQEPPTAGQIRELRLTHKLTQAQAARLVHTTGPVWQQWETPPEYVSPSGRSLSRSMHPAYWELFRIKCAALDAPGGCKVSVAPSGVASFG